MEKPDLFAALERADAAYQRILNSDLEGVALSHAAGLAYSLHGPLFGEALAALKAGGTA